MHPTKPMINPNIYTHYGEITEEALKHRLLFECFAQAGWLDETGHPLKGVTGSIYRGDGRKGGYKVTVTRDLDQSDQPRLTHEGTN